MRRVLVDYARSRQYQKRGAGERPVPVDAALDLHRTRGRELVKLDDALSALAKLHPRKAQVVEMRFFGGLTIEESAEALGVSRDTVIRDWQIARVWLHRALEGRGQHA
jgi:RNA polymerase sigma factor (TIGR02999 family)